MLAKDKKSLLSLIDKAIARSARLSETHAPGTSDTLFICHVLDGDGGCGRTPLKATATARDWLTAEIRSVVVHTHDGLAGWHAMALPHQLRADLNNRMGDIRVESMHAHDDWDRACNEAQFLWDTTANCFRLGVLHALRVKAEQLPEEEAHHG